MKTIKFEGKKYEVGDWVRFISKDSDGHIFGCELKPKLSNSFWDGSNSRSIHLDRTSKTNNWRYSLRKV